VTSSAGSGGTVEQLGAVHFVGIGGAGMSGIARILLARGVPVSGSDAKDSKTLAALRALGAHIDVGHDSSHVNGADTVVTSTAIRASNVELLEAARRGLRILPRAAALAAVMSGRRGIAVAGTAGKTTTTSLLTVALQHAGADPSFAIGGDLNESGANAHHGSGELFIAEADESDGSFLLLSPHAAIVTNVEADHLDYYGTAEAVDEAFAAFLDRIDTDGFLVVGIDDDGGRRLASVARGRGIDVCTYGVAADADVRAVDVSLSGSGSTFFIAVEGRRRGPVTLRIPGRHNVLNATGAYAMLCGLGIAVDVAAEGLASFSGTRRRFEFKGVAAGTRVFDDYAHHPTKLRATLTAARTVADGGRIIAVFQPHRYSRTAAFRLGLAEALGLADEVVVMDVYSAGEDPIPGATGATVAAAVPLPPDRVEFEPSWTTVATRVAARARPGDIVLTLGAGDVTMLGPQILQLLVPENPGDRG
jgi:UDP-N-acetylmuramate--alanine ligase